MSGSIDIKGKEKGLLGNILVLDMADEKGSFCSKILADLGATVIKIERPGSDPARKLGPYYRSNSGSDHYSLFFAYHNANKLGLVLDLETKEGRQSFHGLVKEADILVETYAPGPLDTLDLAHERLRYVNPSLIHISITGFGRTGPRSVFISCDAVVSAFGGQMYLSGTQSGPPVKLYGEQTFYTTSLFGAVAALIGLRRRKITRSGCHIDLSSQEAVASTLDHVMVDYRHRRIVAGRRGHPSQRNLSSIFPCKDGYIEITLLRNWETLLELMAAEGKATDLLEKKWQGQSFREGNLSHIMEVVEDWTRTHTRNELFELGQAMGFPWAPVCTPSDVLKSPQLEARGFFLNASLPGIGSAIPIPGPPYKFDSFSQNLQRPAPLLGEHSRMILERPGTEQEEGPAIIANDRESDQSAESKEILGGIRVVDLTRVLAGPYATRILADFGAEVIKVQSNKTAVGADQNGTPYFNTWNRNKKSITLNLDFPEARNILLRLIAISDMVIENFSPRVMQNWDLTYEQLKKIKPDLIMLSISAMGHTGPWKDCVGYATTFQALSGLTAMTSRFLDEPIRLGHAYGDVITSLYAAVAILAALEHRDRTGKGQYIDLSAYEAMGTLIGPALMEAALGPEQRIEGHHDPEYSMAAPCGCYPCAGDDRWCVIVISRQDEYQAFCRISGVVALKAEQFSTLQKRKKNRSKLDELIGQWTSSLQAETIVQQLQEAGISAGVVQNAEDLTKDRHLAARNFFISLEHPETGTAFANRTALYSCLEKPIGWRPAPSLGEHNREVFVDLMGVSVPEFLSYMEKGIIG